MGREKSLASLILGSSIFFLGTAVSANAAVVWNAKTCREINFFGTPENRWKQITSLEEGFRVAFQKTGERAYRFMAKKEGSHVLSPTTCLVYVPMEAGSILEGRTRLVVNFIWKDELGATHGEGYRVDFSTGMEGRNYTSMRITDIHGFQICRTVENCDKMMADSKRDF